MKYIQSIPLIGKGPVIQQHEGLLTFTFTFNKADKSSDHLELFLEETLRSLLERKWYRIRDNRGAKKSD